MLKDRTDDDGLNAFLCLSTRGSYGWGRYLLLVQRKRISGDGNRLMVRWRSISMAVKLRRQCMLSLCEVVAHSGSMARLDQTWNSCRDRRNVLVEAWTVLGV